MPRAQRLLQLRIGEITAFQNHLRHGAAAGKCFLRHFGRRIITDQRVERGGETDGFFHALRHDRRIGDDAVDAAFRQRAAGGAELADALRQGSHDDWLESVQLQLPGFSGHGDGDVIADHRIGHLIDHFRNDRIDLAWHDAGTRLNGGQGDFANPGARAGREEAKIVAGLRQLHGDAFQHTGEMHEGAGVLGGFDEVCRRHQRSSGQFRQMLAGKLGITTRCIQPGTDGGGAEIDLVQKCCGFDEARLIFSQHHHEGAEFLAERHRHGVLQLRTADLDEAGEFLRLAVEGILQHTHGSRQIVDRLDQADIDRGRIGVVGRLAEIDMVIGVKAGIIAFFVSEQFERTVGDDLIGVHVGGSAGAALNFIHHELLMQRAGANIAAGLGDGFHAFCVQKAELVVCACRRLLHIGQSPDEIGVVADGHPGDLEVFHGARRVHAPIDIRRNFLGPEQIMLLARHAHFFLHWL